MFPVRFYYADTKPIVLKNKKAVKSFILEIFSKEGKTIHKINYIFCSDHYLLEINQKYLNHDFFTDIITFDLTEEHGIIGEIYISVDRVKENAVIHSFSFREELLRVLFHGAIHLCGYDDKKKSEITIMRKKEDYYLQLFKKQTK
jgi:probable rRNA maturation factor